MSVWRCGPTGLSLCGSRGLQVEAEKYPDHICCDPGCPTLVRGRNCPSIHGPLLSSLNFNTKWKLKWPATCKLPQGWFWVLIFFRQRKEIKTCFPLHLFLTSAQIRVPPIVTSTLNGFIILWQGLKGMFPKCAVGTLSNNSHNILQLIVDAYNVSASLFPPTEAISAVSIATLRDMYQITQYTTHV